MKIQWISVILLLCLSCNNTAEKHRERIAEDDFLGTWVYVTSSYEDDGRTNDHSMDGSMMKILKEKNSEETYIGRLNSHRDMIFTRNGNTLEGVNIRMKVILNNRSKHITIYYGNSWQEFKKL